MLCKTDDLLNHSTAKLSLFVFIQNIKIKHISQKKCFHTNDRDKSGGQKEKVKRAVM